MTCVGYQVSEVRVQTTIRMEASVWPACVWVNRTCVGYQVSEVRVQTTIRMEASVSASLRVG